MHARSLHNDALGEVVVRPLADGDEATVAALFERLSPESRARRYHGSKPRLTDSDLQLLARVDRDRHVLVAYVGGAPAALARLVRDGDSAEIAFEVADAYHCRGLGSQLVELLLADARAAGIARVEAYVEPRNRRALALLRRALGRPVVRCEGAELRVAAPLA
jgi:RimJ/RimL family protein N-acetyltransferase